MADTWTYALVTPDGLVTESLPWLLGKLRSSGLRPVAARLIGLESATMLRVYDAVGPNLPPRRAFDLWYGLGPACVLALHHDGPGANAAMLAVKGATQPAAASPDSIRHAGENGLMNLIHCPDDEASAEEELTLLLGPESAREMRRLAVRPDERIRELTVGSLDMALPQNSGRGALSLPLIVNRIRLRLVHRLAIDGASEDFLVSALMETAAALHDERRGLAETATSSARAAVARSHDGKLHDRLVGVARQAQDAAAERALLGLSALLMETPGDWPGLLAAMTASGTYLSGVESAVLEMSTLA